MVVYLGSTAFKVFSLLAIISRALKHRRSSIIGSATREFEMKINSLEADKVWDYENGFHWFSKTNRIKKFLAHYKLYESILSIPGDIVELGVFKGNSLIRFATYRDILERESERRVIGFDAFGEFPRERLSNGDDLEFIEKFEGESGVGLSKEELTTIFTQKRINNVFLVEGNVLRSLPDYYDGSHESAIALLHIDLDVEEPTTFALEFLYNKISPGGVIIFDDYGTVAGETRAVDAFLGKTGLELQNDTVFGSPAFVRKHI